MLTRGTRPFCAARVPQRSRGRTARGRAHARLVAYDASLSGSGLGAPAAGRDPEAAAASARAEVTRRIQALGAAGKLKAAISELASLARLGIQPDTQAATALLSAAVGRGDMTVAESIFNELFVGFLEPDEVTFVVLLRGYGAQQPPAWTHIDTTLSRMRNSYGLQPTAVSYNALLEVCARDNDFERGFSVLDRMAADGVEPDAMTEAIVARRRALRTYLKKLFA